MTRRLRRWFRSKFVYDELQDVRDFHVKFGLLCFGQPGHLTRRKLQERTEFLQEELNEFTAAAQVQDLAGVADALIDLVYVAKGTAVMLGLPWETLWDDVQRANMAKVRGVTQRGHVVDVAKPEGWQPPKTGAILRLHGYAPEDWKDEDDQFCYAGAARDDDPSYRQIKRFDEYLTEDCKP